MVARLKEITDTIYELQSSRFSGSEFNEPIQLGKKTLGCSNFIFKVNFFLTSIQNEFYQKNIFTLKSMLLMTRIKQKWIKCKSILI